MKRTAIIALLALGLIRANAQQLSDVTLTNALDGKSWSMSNVNSSQVMVMIFMSAECPFDNYYYKRVSRLASELGSRATFILVNPNASETAEAMKGKAGANGLSIPWLMDSQQVLLQNLAATKTPEAFVLANTAGKWNVVYRGAIDDNAQVEAEVRQRYVLLAVEAVLAGQSPAQKEARPTGCSVRKREH